MKAHPTAIINPKAKIHSSVEIGPNVIIDEHVTIGAGCRILANAYITGYTTLGENNEIHMGAVVGHVPQDHHFDPKTVSYLEIGSHNIIREYATIHRASKPEGRTKIGDHNFILAQSHVGHDVVIGNRVVIATFCGIAGHCVIGDNTFISGGVVIHQFVEIGRFVIISGDSGFSRNIPPFMVAMARNELGPINLIGLRRGGFSKQTIQDIKTAYRIFFYSDKTKEEALREVEAAGLKSPEVQEFVDFIRKSKRPIAHHYKGKEKAADE